MSLLLPGGFDIFNQIPAWFLSLASPEKDRRLVAAQLNTVPSAPESAEKKPLSKDLVVVKRWL